MKNPIKVLLKWVNKKRNPPPPRYKHIWGSQYVCETGNRNYKVFETGYLFRVNIETRKWDVRRFDFGWREADENETKLLEFFFNTKQTAALYYEKPPQ